MIYKIYILFRGCIFYDRLVAIAIYMHMKGVHSMKKMLKLSILSISMITVMASAAVSPALGNISSAFPNESMTSIKMILTLPFLFIIPFSLLSSKLTKYFGKKNILILGILIYLVGGVGVVFINSLLSVLFFRAILGAGCGLIMPISQGLIAEFFTGEERVKVTGYSGSASYFMGIISSFIVTYLSSIKWKYGFYIYLIAVVVLILNVISLPKDNLVLKSKTETYPFNKKVIWIALATILINIAFYAVPANAALFIKTQNIGSINSPGIAIGFFMLFGFIAGIILTYIQRITGKFTVAFAILLMGLGYISLYLAYNMLPIILGVSLVGFSFGIIYPNIFIATNNICSNNSNSKELSLVSSCVFLGQFISPLVLQSIGKIFHDTSIRFNFLTLSICLLIGFFISIIGKSRRR